MEGERRVGEERETDLSCSVTPPPPLSGARSQDAMQVSPMAARGSLDDLLKPSQPALPGAALEEERSVLKQALPHGLWTSPMAA